MASQTLNLGQLGSVPTSLCLFTLLAGSLWIAYRRLAPYGNIAETDFEGRVDRVLKSTPLIDGHNDLPYLLRIELQNRINSGKFTFRDGKKHTVQL